MTAKHNDFTWVRALRRYWILPAEMASRVLLAAALATLLYGVWDGPGGRATGAGVGLLAASLAAELVHHRLFYRAIRCPACGHNPTRYANGRNRPTAVAWARLRRLDRCPRCGYLGRDAA